MEEQNGALIKAEETIPAERPISILEGMGYRRTAIEAAIRMTRRSGGWINMGGQPYLTKSGADAITQLLPIRTEFKQIPKKHWESDDIGPYYIYICVAAASWTDEMKGYSEAIGTCSSRDKFFARRHGETLPTSDIDEPNIIKKCGTNGIGNAIKGLLALKSMTWEELDRIAGLQEGETQKVEYGSTRKQDENPEEADNYRRDLGNMILEMCHDNVEEAQNYLQAVTTFKGRDGKQVRGKRSVKDLSEKQAQITHGKVKKQFDKWRAAQKTEDDDNTEKPDTNEQEDLV